MIIQATFSYQSERLYAAIVLSSSLAIFLFVIVVVIERLMLRYQH
jgi:NitT/TauT family transport system permease protein